MGLLDTLAMSDAERMAHAVQRIEPETLEAVRTLLERLLDGAGSDEDIGVLDLAGETSRVGRFLLSARAALVGALEQLQASMAAQTARGHRGPLTTLVLLEPSNGRIWTRGKCAQCAQCIERRIGDRPTGMLADEVVDDARPGLSEEAAAQPLGATAAGEVLRELLAARESSPG